MPPSKGLTRQTRLRMTEDEYELLAKAMQVYDRNGVEMSQNDMIRHLIRRAGIVLAHTPEESLTAIRKHCETCEHCEFKPRKLGCPDGLYLFRSYRRVQRAHAGARPGSAL